MRKSLRFIAASTLLAMLAGCASEGGLGHTATYGGVGAVAGAAAGALLGGHNRGKGALIGAALGGVAGSGYGYYADKQEEQLRHELEGSGVEVQRQGEVIKLIMPGSITFSSNSADVSSNFYNPLNQVAASLKQYDQSNIDIVGHTDSTGARQRNIDLSQLRAASVGNYLISQGVAGTRIVSRGVGPDQPIASNASEAGRQQNRRVEINLRPSNPAR